MMRRIAKWFWIRWVILCGTPAKDARRRAGQLFRVTKRKP
jgi:hypothetical protein